MLGCAHTTAYKIFWLINNASETVKQMLRKGTMTITTTYATLFKDGKLVGYWRDYHRSDQMRYPYCLKCKSKTITPKESRCHVHLKICCTNCGWGF